MKFIERQQDLFTVDSKYTFVHCVSVDCEMGAGIAKEFQKRYNLKGAVKARCQGLGTATRFATWDRYVGWIWVFNLMTKHFYWHKPSYETLRLSLLDLKKQCLTLKINYLAMPQIGCGLDRLNWNQVKEIIIEIFEDTDIEILVCSLK